jgi:hypothetical protein
VINEEALWLEFMHDMLKGGGMKVYTSNEMMGIADKLVAGHKSRFVKEPAEPQRHLGSLER